MDKKKLQYIKRRDALALAAGSDQVGLKPSAMRAKLEALPGVDAVQVIRCQDCRHCNKNTFLLYCTREMHKTMRKPDDFCSYGEKEG